MSALQPPIALPTLVYYQTGRTQRQQPACGSHGRDVDCGLQALLVFGWEQTVDV